MLKHGSLVKADEVQFGGPFLYLVTETQVVPFYLDLCLDPLYYELNVLFIYFETSQYFYNS